MPRALCLLLVLEAAASPALARQHVWQADLQIRSL
jgi:hypothetical protein